MADTTIERVSVAARGVRFPAGLADLLNWARYNCANRRTVCELNSLPWRSYRNVTDVAEEIASTRGEQPADRHTCGAEPH